MKHTISGFNQSKLIEYGLDLKDALLLRYFVDFRDADSMSMIIVEGKPYYWLNYKHLKEDIPIIGINNNDSLRKRLKKLENCKVLGHYHKLEGGSYSYYCLGENYKYLIKKVEDGSNFNNYNPPVKKSYPVQPKSRTLPIEKSEQNNLSTKDNNYIYSSDDIELIWGMYPNKKGRAQAIKKIPKIISSIGINQLIRCIERYSLECKGKDKQFILNGSTFFNGRYEDYLDYNFTDEKTENKEEIKPKENKYKFILEDM
ncbi:hypothetical protein [Clostridium sp.]|uniref:hypothetical protein n=1 Tax=Clostridium sp. TaxID=1506 RepID=UPI001DA87405|nr:hypothetical protein [Clostridium sp.]MBS5986471.1 hypothetical protein [Clostridium sp.]